MTVPSRSPHRDRGRVRDMFHRSLTAIFTIAGGAALLFLLGVTVAEVVARHLVGASLLGAEDLATMGLSVLVAAAMVGAALESGHVSIDLIGRRGRFARVVNGLSRLLATGATAAAALALFAKGGCSLECGEITGSLAIVHTPFYYALGASMAICSLLVAFGMPRGSAAGFDGESRGRGH